MEKEHFYIQIKPHDTIFKPQQKTIQLNRLPWDIEWSTVAGVSMMIDFYNLTIGRYLKDQSADGQKKIEEFWRASMIPGHARKVRYGQNVESSTSTPPKPLVDGIFVVKISAQSSIADGLNVESGVGIAVIKIELGVTLATEMAPVEPANQNRVAERMPERTPDGIRIVDDNLIRLLKLLDQSSS